MKKIARITAGLILSFLFMGQIYAQNATGTTTTKESQTKSTATVTPCKFIDTNKDGICDNCATCMKEGKYCKQTANCCGKGNQVKQCSGKSGNELKGCCQASTSCPKKGQTNGSGCKSHQGCCNKAGKTTNPPSSSDSNKK